MMTPSETSSHDSSPAQNKNTQPSTWMKTLRTWNVNTQPRAIPAPKEANTSLGPNSMAYFRECAMNSLLMWCEVSSLKMISLSCSPLKEMVVVVGTVQEESLRWFLRRLSSFLTYSSIMSSWCRLWSPEIYIRHAWRVESKEKLR